MRVVFTKGFQKTAAQLQKRDVSLKNRLIKQFELFSRNATHPSVKLHKLKGKRAEQYAIWIKADLRIIAIKKQDVYVFFDLITHDRY